MEKRFKVEGKETERKECWVGGWWLRGNLLKGNVMKEDMRRTWRGAAWKERNEVDGRKGRKTRGTNKKGKEGYNMKAVHRNRKIKNEGCEIRMTKIMKEGNKNKEETKDQNSRSGSLEVSQDEVKHNLD